MSFHVLILRKLATRWVVNIIYDVRKPLMILPWCNIAIYMIGTIQTPNLITNTAVRNRVNIGNVFRLESIALEPVKI